MGRDKLLQEVIDSWPCTPVDWKNAPVEVKRSGEAIERRLRLIRLRSKEELTDFRGFYCLRLLLDRQSPHASYFIDLFSHFEFLLLQLRSLLVRFLESSPRHSVEEALCSLFPVPLTCRLLYATCEMLPITAEDPLQLPGAQILADGQFKRKGERQGRQFSSNLLHCRMRHIASVYLDQEGCSRLSLKEELGTGASATVYRAAFEGPGFDHGRLKTGGFVAVKMFKDGGIDGSSSLSTTFGRKLFQSIRQQGTEHLHSGSDEFLAELDKLIMAKHPNIVSPIGYIGKRTEGECGLVMELMDGSLSDYLEKVNRKTVPPLKELDMLDLMLEIARGMRFLHECELIHLDLKPTNILLRFSDGEDQPPVEVKIADLGITTLATFFADEKKGTSCYMAPELRDRHSHIDEKADVFSYGTTCFNILMGNPDTFACSESTGADQFYEGVKTGRWKKWVRGHNPFLVKLIGRCWEMDCSIRPTFAMLCIFLQHGIQMYLLVPSSLVYDATKCLAPASITMLKEYEHDKKKSGHFQIYKAISKYSKSYFVGPFNLEEMERRVLHFESHTTAQTDRPLILDKKLSTMERLLGQAPSADDGESGIGDVATDHVSTALISLEKGRRSRGSEAATDHVSIFLNSLKSGHFDRAISFRNKIAKETRCKWSLQWWGGPKKDVEVHLPDTSVKSCINEAEAVHFRNIWMESCFDEADPLLLIKVEAYRMLLSLRNIGNTIVGDLGRSMQESRRLQESEFKIEEDEARTPLQVDTSLIPLLVAFWSGPVGRGTFAQAGAHKWSVVPN